MISPFTFEAGFVIVNVMKAVHSIQEEVERVNNRLVTRPQVSTYQPTNGRLFIELMQVLQATQKKAKENPKGAELNKTSMCDNNGGRIIYTLVDFL